MFDDSEDFAAEVDEQEDRLFDAHELYARQQGYTFANFAWAESDNPLSVTSKVVGEEYSYLTSTLNSDGTVSHRFE